MKLNEIDERLKFNSNYEIDERKYIIAIKDISFPDKNILPITYYDSENDTWYNSDLTEKIWVPQTNQYYVEPLDNRFHNLELIKIFKSLVNNNRHNENPSLPKYLVYPNQIESLDSKDIIEVFQGEIDFDKLTLNIPNKDLRDFLKDFYADKRKALLVKDLKDLNGLTYGPFYLSQFDENGFFSISKAVNNVSKFNFDNQDLLTFSTNNIDRTIVSSGLVSKGGEIVDFISSTDLIEWAMQEISLDNDFSEEQRNQYFKYLSLKIDSDLKEYGDRFIRLKNILETYENSIKEKQDFIIYLKESKEFRESIDNKKEELLKLENERKILEKNIENLKIEKEDLEKDIYEKKDLLNETNSKLESEKQNLLTEEINKLEIKKKELEDLINKAEIQKSIEDIEAERRVLERYLQEDKSKQEELKRQLENLRSEFISSQKDANEKLKELIKSKTHFDFINNRDFSSDFAPEHKDILDLRKNDFVYNGDLRQFIRDVSHLLNQNGRIFKEHFVANILISIFQNSLTIFSGLPGTGKTSLSRILCNSVTDSSRIVEVPISRGWTSQKDFIGFSNPLSKKFYEAPTGVYKLLCTLDEEYKKDKDWSLESPIGFIILDEANLSPLEHYWSSFYNLTDSTSTTEKLLEINLGNGEIIKYPNNLRFIGTINIDRTTEELSPRLLDRVNIIRIDPSNFSISDLNNIKNKIISFKEIIKAFELKDFQDIGLNTKSISDLKFEQFEDDKYSEIKRKLKELNILISPRVEIAIKDYCYLARKVMIDKFRPLDYAISQRVLTKIDLQGNYTNQLHELMDIFNSFNLEDSSSKNILSKIIERGTKDDYTRNNFNYFLI